MNHQFLLVTTNNEEFACDLRLNGLRIGNSSDSKGYGF